MMRDIAALILLAASSTCAPAAEQPLPQRWAILATPAMNQPGYLQPVSDPAFGAKFERITDPGVIRPGGLQCERPYCRHRYSSTQAWNADQSLLVIMNGCEGMCFLDGRTYKPLFHRDASDDCKWHPVDPSSMICVTKTRVYRWRPAVNETTTIFTPSNYSSLEFGPYKGNLSFDGSKLALRARDARGRLVVFVYDLDRKFKYPDIDLASLSGENTSCGIAATGRYLICFQLEADKTETAYVFSADGARIGFWPEHHRPAHGDMTIDADGADVYVGISKAGPDKWHIIKRRLSDGAVTDLAPAGYATHISARCIRRPGWVIASYEGTYQKVLDSPGWAPFYQEVVALRIDGSGEIRRIAQTHNRRVDYYSETHASASPDASRVVWSSNWDEGPVADYVSEIAWPSSPPDSTATSTIPGPVRR